MRRGEHTLRWWFYAIWAVAIALLVFIVVYRPLLKALNFVFVTLRGG